VDLWQVLKDILLTGTGMALMVSQVFSLRPSDILLVTGLALTVPSVAGHAGALLTGGRHGRTGGESSPPSPRPGELPSGPPPGGTVE
jgi:hypothetical protein